MRTIAVIGLGYVGLGLAVALSKNYPVIGYDISQNRINELLDNLDRNQCVSEDELKLSTIRFTNALADAKKANFYIVAVSTPAYFYEHPNLEPLINATKDVATVLKKGDVVVFESTVYPGTTDEICLPLLEKYSHLQNGDDFSVGYSPERISPSIEEHTLKNITKVISAQNEATLKIVREVYESICDTVYPVSNMKTAEATKVLENTQRDVNIAFMNEYAEIMHGLDIDMHEIIEAAKTKWSFIHFKPGLVGGHCIAVDPHYIAFKAKRIGVQPDLILAARKINDNMPQFIVDELIKIFIKNKLDTTKIKVGVFGITYKENIPDIRNSLALKLLKILNNYGFTCQVNDPYADKDIVKNKYHVELLNFDEITELSVAIIVAQHNLYRETGLDPFLAKFKGKQIIMDIPNLFIDQKSHLTDAIYWNL